MNLMLGLGTMVVCLALQALLVGGTIRHYANRKSSVLNGSLLGSFRLLSRTMLILVFGNLLQVGLWALLFEWLGEFDTLGEAYYHSAVNFATLGYGDLVMSDDHRLLGPLEAINGVLMIGVSTAVLMGAVQDLIRRPESAS